MKLVRTVPIVGCFAQPVESGGSSSQFFKLCICVGIVDRRSATTPIMSLQGPALIASSVEGCRSLASSKLMAAFDQLSCVATGSVFSSFRAVSPITNPTTVCAWG